MMGKLFAFREWLRLSLRLNANALPLVSRMQHFVEPPEESMRDALTGAHNRRYFGRVLKALRRPHLNQIRRGCIRYASRSTRHLICLGSGTTIKPRRHFLAVFN